MKQCLAAPDSLLLCCTSSDTLHQNTCLQKHLGVPRLRGHQRALHRASFCQASRLKASFITIPLISLSCNLDLDSWHSKHVTLKPAAHLLLPLVAVSDVEAPSELGLLLFASLVLCPVLSTLLPLLLLGLGASVARTPQAETGGARARSLSSTEVKDPKA
eukprot:scaffold75896_cov19-Tisochrysis_lutea.AAC.9